MTQILLVGLSHHTAPLVLREQLTLAEHDLDQTLRQLSGQGLDEVAILTTCNRLEFYAVGQSSTPIELLLASLGDLTPETLAPHLYVETGRAAVDHLMRVAAGLDSMILGEQQILGQVQLSFEFAQAAGTAGPVLSHLLAQAAHAGKRARHETEVSRHTTSISHAAVKLAGSQLGDLQQARALVVGGGEMATLAAQALNRHNIGDLTCINRSFERAQTLATQFEGQARTWDQLPQALAEADVVISATSAPTTIIHPEDIQSPLVIIDIALPRDVAAGVSALPDVHYYDLDDLKTYVEANLARREAATADVEIIIDEEAARFEEWLRGRSVAPVITALRDKVTAVADDEVAAALRRLGDLDEDQQKVVEHLAHRIVNKILHAPTVCLRDDNEYAAAVLDLFDLDVEEPV